MTKFPKIALFFEISVNDYHGFLSAIFSLIVWSFIYLSTKIEIGKKEAKSEREASKKAIREDVKKLMEEDQKIWEKKWNEENGHQD